MIANNKTYYAPMHTAEHILNQTMIRLFNCGRSITNHIEKKKSKCDYRFERDLTEIEKNLIEKKVNDVIAMDLEIQDTILPATEAMQQFKLERMPENETIRVVLVGNYDACACSGNHVKRTSEIGTFRFINHQYENGILRVRFKLENPSSLYD